MHKCWPILSLRSSLQKVYQSNVMLSVGAPAGAVFGVWAFLTITNETRTFRHCKIITSTSASCIILFVTQIFRYGAVCGTRGWKMSMHSLIDAHCQISTHRSASRYSLNSLYRTGKFKYWFVQSVPTLLIISIWLR